MLPPQDTTAWIATEEGEDSSLLIGSTLPKCEAGSPPRRSRCRLALGIAVAGSLVALAFMLVSGRLGLTGTSLTKDEILKLYSGATKTNSALILAGSPPNISRKDTSYDWCRCENGLDGAGVTFWPEGEKRSGNEISVKVGEIKWVKFDKTVSLMSWTCAGSDRVFTSHFTPLTTDMWLSLVVYRKTKGKKRSIIKKDCGLDTARMHWNTWTETSYVSSVPFTSGTEGYSCFKIPALLRTSKGTLIAYSEARKPDCSDFAQTDLVYKRSEDGGKTWGKLSLVVKPAGNRSKMGVCGHSLAIGNTAPVQLASDSKKHPGRILAPYMRNNFKTWITYSDDDGVTWKDDHEIKGAQQVDDAPVCNRNMTYLGYDIDTLDLENTDEFVKFAAFLCHDCKDAYNNPKWSKTLKGPWQFVGVGPPGSLQLKSGRVIVPGYHSYIRGIEGEGKLPISQLFNNFALGHALISDDGGDTWKLTTDYGRGQGLNENQMVQLSSGQVLANSRSLATGSPQMRLQARSDDEGETFSASEFVKELPQPLNGCQGSMVLGALGNKSAKTDDTVYVTTPDPDPANSVLQKLADQAECKLDLTGRTRVTLWTSKDGGKTYPNKTLIDPGLSAQTSLQYNKGSLVLLYEQADPPAKDPASWAKHKLLENMVVLLPERFVYKELVAAGSVRNQLTATLVLCALVGLSQREPML